METLCGFKVVTPDDFDDGVLPEGRCSKCGNLQRQWPLPHPDVASYDIDECGIFSGCCHAEVFEDSEAPTVRLLQKTTHRARKNHGKIKAGERYYRRVFLCEGGDQRVIIDKKAW